MGVNALNEDISFSELCGSEILASLAALRAKVMG